MSRNQMLRFPNLEVLSDIVARAETTLAYSFQNTMFVCVQHLLETTGSLIEALIRLGVAPSRVFVLGKCYSTNKSVLRCLQRLGIHAASNELPGQLGYYRAAITDDVSKLWSLVLTNLTDDIESIVIVDDGGDCITGIPHELLGRIKNIVGIEQTTSGLSQLRAVGCPVIEVASCAVKRFIEPPLIARAVCEKISALLPVQPQQKCGIVGYGHIGRAVSSALISSGHEVAVYDIIETRHQSPIEVHWCANVSDLLAKADFIFGCTGTDALPFPEIQLKHIESNKTFFSCSSGDSEFSTLLRYIQASSPNRPGDPLGMIRYEHPYSRLDVSVYRGGFPANFDGTSESVPRRDIQLTRGLLLVAILQALTLHREPLSYPRGEMLSPTLQKFVLSSWLEHRQPEAKLMSAWPDMNDFLRLDTLASGSGGEHRRTPAIDAIFRVP